MEKRNSESEDRWGAMSAARTAALQATRVTELGWIEVDPNVSFQDRIAECDLDGGAHKSITCESTQAAGRVRRLIVLYEPPCPVFSSEMEALMKEKGDRPCVIDDGIVISDKFPACQVKNPLPLLGSLCKGRRHLSGVPVLAAWKERPSFGVVENCGMWGPGYVFPAVRREEVLDT